jgi:hypothetical protein
MKLSLIGFVLLGSLTTSIEKPFIKQTTEEKEGKPVPIPARTKQGPELLFTPYFEIKPVEDKDKPKRELWPVDPAKAAADAAEGESK